MQAPASIADAGHELTLDEAVHVFVLAGHPRRILAALFENGREGIGDRLRVGGIEHPGVRQRLSAAEGLIRFSPSVAAAYAGVLARGEWFSPLRQGLDAYVTSTQEGVSGTVRVRLFKGDSRMVGRSGKSLLRTPNP